MVADRHADSRDRVGFGAEYAERQVLDRKIIIRTVGVFDKTAPRRIVGLVEIVSHDASLIAQKLAAYRRVGGPTCSLFSGR